MRILIPALVACAICAPAGNAQEPKKGDGKPAAEPKAADVSKQPRAADLLKQPGKVPPAADCPPATSLLDEQRLDGRRFWGSIEYLLWWTKGQHAPPLVTTSVPGTPVLDAGVIGLPTTAVLYGGRPLDVGLRQGGRFTLGYWLDDCQERSIGGSYFQLEDRAEHFNINSTGTPIVARPFFDVIQGIPAAQITAFPGVAAGCIDISSFTQFLGADLFVRKTLCKDCCRRIELQAGYRFLLLRDGLTVNELVIATAGTEVLPVGAAFSITDSFRTVNQFHGVDLGLIYRHDSGPWFVEAMGRAAVGLTGQRTTIQGTTRIEVPGNPPDDFAAGLLALESNIGEFRNVAFSFVPELRLSAGCYLCENVSVFAGYNFLYWLTVVRAAEQVDLRINPNLLPPSQGGAPRLPTVVDSRNGFWAQGINFGISVNY